MALSPLKVLTEGYACSKCAYSTAGLTTDEHDRVTCPECGHSHEPFLVLTRSEAHTMMLMGLVKSAMVSAAMMALLVLIVKLNIDIGIEFFSFMLTGTLAAGALMNGFTWHNCAKKQGKSERAWLFATGGAIMGGFTSLVVGAIVAVLLSMVSAS